MSIRQSLVVRSVSKGAGSSRPRVISLAVLCVAFSIGAVAEATASDVPSPGAAAPTANAPPADESVSDPVVMDRFLDRLMISESGGRDDARNPRSTALGPFQFIESTFLDVLRRHGIEQAANLSNGALLALRTNRAIARRAAEAYTRDNAAHLVAAGVAPTFGHLRLAFLVGPGGAARVLKAPPTASVAGLLGARVVQANPFMVRMSAGELAAWAHRSLSAQDVSRARLHVPPGAGGSAPPARPRIAVRCDRGLASCRRWIALAIRRQGLREASAAKRLSRQR